MFLIIGGSGFVGSKLISDLDPKNCINFDKRPSHYFNEITKIGNICNPNEIIISREVKSVILLAAEHRDDVSPTSLYYDVNVEGTQNVLNKMDEAGVKRLIFTSSVAIYGLDKNNPSEDHNEDPFNHYGKSKWQAEVLIKKWYYQNPKEKSVTIIRPTVIFGPRNRGNVYNLLKQISSRKFLMIGSGNNKKSLAYIANVVAFIKHNIERESTGFEVFNYADKPDYSMRELVNIIEKKMNMTIPKFRVPYLMGIIAGFCFDLIGLILRKKLPVSSVRIKKFCATTQFDSNKAHASFSAPYSLKEGLFRTLEHEFINKKKDDVLFYSE